MMKIILDGSGSDMPCSQTIWGLSRDTYVCGVLILICGVLILICEVLIYMWGLNIDMWGLNIDM